jgi:hypothetical protein
MNSVRLGADAYSIVTNINMISIPSYSIVWTGTPTGTFQVEVCNDYVPNPPGVIDSDPNNGSWTSLTTVPPENAVGSPGSGFMDVPLTGAVWIRLHYVYASGTGSAKATIGGKCA